VSTHGIDAAAGSMPASDVPRYGTLGAIQSGVSGLNTVLAIGSALAIAAAGAVLTWEVMGRYFFEIASDWQDELSTFLLIGATFGAAGWIQAKRGHVAIDALTHILPRGIDAVRKVMADLFSFMFVTFFAWKSWTLFYEAWDEGQTTPSAWGPPLWIPYGCMALGMTLLAVQLLLQVVGSRHRESQPAHLAPSPPLPIG
jgi:TRAP-type C4-dicarboxylate transport system permease small subunit